MIYPEYCCAILIQNNALIQSNSAFLMQLRPSWSRHAPNKLVCFGGKREAGELPEVCIHRELEEEINWVPEQLTLAVQLWIDDRLKAWFYVGNFDVELARIQTEPGFEAKLITADSLEQHPISAWHHAVLDAYLQNNTVVKL